MPREGFWMPPQFEQRLKVYASLAALAGALVVGAALLVVFVSFSWPEAEVGSPLARIYAGESGDFEIAQPVQFPEGKFWLVKKEDGSFIALSWSDPRNGCTIPWREGFRLRDPQTGDDTSGWFPEPCHGSTYNVYGVRVFGPSAWDMNQYPVEVVGEAIYVHATPNDLMGRVPPTHPDWITGR